jgi:predicted RNA binding protein YcfA (HicA-like mRNA interferase family)
MPKFRLEDGRQTYLPMHARDVPTGAFRSILKQAGLTEEEFSAL